MNILYFFEYAPDPQRGGASRLTNSLVNYWKQQKKEYTFFCAYLKKEKDYTSYFQDEYQANLQDDIGLRLFLEKNNIQLILNQMGFSKEYMEYIIKCNISNIPIITTYHSMPGWEISFTQNILNRLPWRKASLSQKIKKTLLPIYLKHINKLVSKRNRYIYNNSAQYIVLSKSYIPLFQRVNNIKDSSKLIAISNPLSFPEIKKIDLTQKKDYVLIVGRFSESEKRFLLALQAWEKVEKKIPNIKWKLIIVGFGNDENLYKEFVAAHKLKNVIFEGKKNPLEYYKKSSIFLMTSAFEGFPLTLNEAQQLGAVPIVMDSFASLHDIIRDSYNGIIIPNNNIGLMANAILDLMLDKKRRESMALNGSSFIRKFSVDHIAKEWESIFKQYQKKEYGI